MAPRIGRARGWVEAVDVEEDVWGSDAKEFFRGEVFSDADEETASVGGPASSLPSDPEPSTDDPATGAAPVGETEPPRVSPQAASTGGPPSADAGQEAGRTTAGVTPLGRLCSQHGSFTLPALASGELSRALADIQSRRVSQWWAREVAGGCWSAVDWAVGGVAPRIGYTLSYREHSSRLTKATRAE